MKTITNKLKFALVAVGMLAVGTVSAQISTNQTDNTNDITKNANSIKGNVDGAVKVIDNKGTIKYLQSNNGITSFTNFDPTSGGEVTTWQLGGTLSTDTTIGLATNDFTIDGVNYKLENIATTTATAATATTAASAGANGNEWTVLVRNEQTGNVEKILAADLLQVQGIHATASVDATDQGLNSKTITVTGITATTSFYKVSVYRNGAKLVAGTDYTFAADAVTVAGAANFNMYDGDQIEINYIR